MITINQEILDCLIADSFELHCYGDMSEINDFLYELADKYNLKFDAKLFNTANNLEYYKNNI